MRGQRVLGELGEVEDGDREGDGWAASVRDAGFCHDAKLGGVNLLQTCVGSCETHKYTHHLR